MKIGGFFALFILLAAVFFFNAALVKASEGTAVYYSDGNGHFYQKTATAAPTTRYFDSASRIKVTNENLRFIYTEKYGNDYPEMFYNLDHAGKGESFHYTKKYSRDYETDFDDGHSDCNWNSRYGERYNRINNCWFN